MAAEAAARRGRAGGPNNRCRSSIEPADHPRKPAHSGNAPGGEACGAHLSRTPARCERFDQRSGTAVTLPAGHSGTRSGPQTSATKRRLMVTAVSQRRGAPSSANRQPRIRPGRASPTANAPLTKLRDRHGSLRVDVTLPWMPDVTSTSRGVHQPRPTSFRSSVPGPTSRPHSRQMPARPARHDGRCVLHVKHRSIPEWRFRLGRSGSRERRRTCARLPQDPETDLAAPRPLRHQAQQAEAFSRPPVLPAGRLGDDQPTAEAEERRCGLGRPRRSTKAPGCDQRSCVSTARLAHDVLSPAKEDLDPVLPAERGNRPLQEARSLAHAVDERPSGRRPHGSEHEGRQAPSRTDVDTPCPI